MTSRKFNFALQRKTKQKAPVGEDTETETVLSYITAYP